MKEMTEGELAGTSKITVNLKGKDFIFVPDFLLKEAVGLLRGYVDECPHGYTHKCGLCDDVARDFLSRPEIKNVEGKA